MFKHERNAVTYFLDNIYPKSAKIVFEGESFISSSYVKALCAAYKVKPQHLDVALRIARKALASYKQVTFREVTTYRRDAFLNHWNAGAGRDMYTYTISPANPEVPLTLKKTDGTTIRYNLKSSVFSNLSLYRLSLEGADKQKQDTPSLRMISRLRRLSRTAAIVNYLNTLLRESALDTGGGTTLIDDLLAWNHTTDGESVSEVAPITILANIDAARRQAVTFAAYATSLQLNGSRSITIADFSAMQRQINNLLTSFALISSDELASRKTATPTDVIILVGLSILELVMQIPVISDGVTEDLWDTPLTQSLIGVDKTWKDAVSFDYTRTLRFDKPQEVELREFLFSREEWVAALGLGTNQTSGGVFFDVLQDIYAATRKGSMARAVATGLSNAVKDVLQFNPRTLEGVDLAVNFDTRIVNAYANSVLDELAKYTKDYRLFTKRKEMIGDFMKNRMDLAIRNYLEAKRAAAPDAAEAITLKSYIDRAFLDVNAVFGRITDEAERARMRDFFIVHLSTWEHTRATPSTSEIKSAIEKERVEIKDWIKEMAEIFVENFTAEGQDADGFALCDYELDTVSDGARVLIARVSDLLAHQKYSHQAWFVRANAKYVNDKHVLQQMKAARFDVPLISSSNAILKGFTATGWNNGNMLDYHRECLAAGRARDVKQLYAPDATTTDNGTIILGKLDRLNNWTKSLGLRLDVVVGDADYTTEVRRSIYILTPPGRVSDLPLFGNPDSPYQIASPFWSFELVTDAVENLATESKFLLFTQEMMPQGLVDSSQYHTQCETMYLARLRQLSNPGKIRPYARLDEALTQITFSPRRALTADLVMAASVVPSMSTVSYLASEDRVSLPTSPTNSEPDGAFSWDKDALIPAARDYDRYRVVTVSIPFARFSERIRPRLERGMIVRMFPIHDSSDMPDEAVEKLSDGHRFFELVIGDGVPYDKWSDGVNEQTPVPEKDGTSTDGKSSDKGGQK